MNKFSISMENNPLNNETITKDSISEALNYLQKDVLSGNNNFMVLQNEESDNYIQTVFKNDEFIVEMYFPSTDRQEEQLLRKSYKDFEKVEELFINFFNEIPIDVSSFENITSEIL